jgi:hypothetical protein
VGPVLRPTTSKLSRTTSRNSPLLLLLLLLLLIATGSPLVDAVLYTETVVKDKDLGSCETRESTGADTVLYKKR